MLGKWLKESPSVRIVPQYSKLPLITQVTFITLWHVILYLVYYAGKNWRECEINHEATLLDCLELPIQGYKSTPKEL